jgi:single-strand DNA-binding protein
MYVNKAIIYGNLTRDPELRSLPTGNKVTSFSVATNRTWKGQDGTRQEAVDFHNIVVFGRQAETVAQYLKKGSGVFIEGRMQTRSWDAGDGTKKYRTEVIADRVQFGPRSGGTGSAGGQGQQAPSSPIETGTDEAIEYPEGDINPNDIPF